MAASPSEWPSASSPRIARAVGPSVSEASARGFDTMFGDYLTMYLALAEPRRALEVGRGLPDTAIDDGNTRSQLLAWLLAARAGQLRGAR